MKKLVIIILFALYLISVKGQTITAEKLYNEYENFKELTLNQERIDPDLVNELIGKLKSSDVFEIKLLGKSLEGRNIHLIRYGSGKTKVLLWSQMHGDESTATQALFDIFNFLAAKNGFKDFKELLSQKLTLYFIPMLNPDGAYNFGRRNALEIDLNRDAERLQFPESQILKSVRDSLSPQFGFNLHDQMRYYAAGNTFKSATISFLAPAYNYQKDINEVRANTMKVIVDIKNALSEIIPGHIGRYSDDFEPRAFGDNLVKWGTSSILIESGGWYNDNEKQFVRKLNFIAILSALQSIANGSYVNNTIEEYSAIPQNDKLLFDLIIRNATINFNGKDYKIDIAIKNNEKELGNGEYYYRSTIEDIGDLSVFYGYNDIDAAGYTIHPGKIFKKGNFNPDKIDEIISEGYTDIFKEDLTDKRPYSLLPINFTNNEDYKNEIKIDAIPNFYLEKNGRIDYVIINGFLYNAVINKSDVKNGLIHN